MSSLDDLIEAMIGYLQSAGTMAKDLATQAGAASGRGNVDSTGLSARQVTKLWLMVHERMQASAGFSHVVRVLIGRQLESGRARAAVIAAQLNISRQTLHSRLKKENQTFVALLDQVRREWAISYLQDPDHPLTDVAQRLGFSELSAFSRAFRRWMGQSPTDYRASLVTSS